MPRHETSASSFSENGNPHGHVFGHPLPGNPYVTAAFSVVVVGVSQGCNSCKRANEQVTGNSPRHDIT